MDFVGLDQNMDCFDDNFIDEFFDCSFINDVTSPQFSFVHSSTVEIDFSQAGSVLQEQESHNQFPIKQSVVDIDFSQAGSDDHELEFDMELPKKRGRTDATSKTKTKACRERERREKLNESFVSLSSVLEPGRVAKSDKLAILSDAIGVVKKLRSKAEEHKEENRRLQLEIESLKAEKNELREEKLSLKHAKLKMELHLKASPASTPGLIPSYPPPPAYPAESNKMGMYPSYGMYPMWHYLPQSIRDTTHDHVLRPPAA